jgi:hypothetical protein
MPFDRRAAIEARLARYRLIEQQLAAEPDSDSDHELKRLRRVIADLELQLEELSK